MEESQEARLAAVKRIISKESVDLLREELKTELTPTKVYLLIYAHRHGEDYYAFRTYEAAKKAAGSLMLEWIGEFFSSTQLDEDGDFMLTGTGMRIKELIEKDQVLDAKSIWEDYTGELFTLQEVEVE